MVSLLFFAKNTYYFMIEKLFKEVFIMKKFLRGVLCWTAEIIMLPVTLISCLFIYPIMGVYYRINGIVDSFKEYWVMIKDELSDELKLKNMMIEYGFREGCMKFYYNLENKE